jgi:hypothetical protein
VEEARRCASMHEFDLPEGIVGEWGGVEWGQRQRLEIAQARLKNLNVSIIGVCPLLLTPLRSLIIRVLFIDKKMALHSTASSSKPSNAGLRKNDCSQISWGNIM